jgi:hypothetical protein
VHVGVTGPDRGAVAERVAQFDEADTGPRIGHVGCHVLVSEKRL